MPTPPDPTPEQRIVGCSLSNFLADRRRRIVTDWMSHVLADKGVPVADELTIGQLKDHIPEILEDLNLTLADAFNEEIKDRAAWRAATHGNIRWQQRYDISQLIREISDLRTVLIYHLAEFHDERTSDAGGRMGIFAMVVVHSFFDGLIRISIEQFVAMSNLNKQS